MKVFGQEFEISTPSLVVFLAGCGIFILPFLLPAQHLPTTANGPTPSTPRIEHQPGDQQNHVITLPNRPLGDAPEPNDGIYEATPIVFGSSIKGKLTPSDPIDWYTFKTSENIEEDVLVICRIVSGDTYVKFEVFDADEKTVAHGDYDNHSIHIQAEKNQTYFVKVRHADEISGSQKVSYELAVRSASPDTSK